LDANGITQPSCAYFPNPDYTKPAREAKSNGSVLLEAVLSAEQRIATARIVKGIPYGLNQAAIDAQQTWKLKPATLKGAPVEIMFRLT
jgi:TonB family protein